MERANPVLREFVAERAQRHAYDVGDTISDTVLRDGTVSTVSSGMIILQRILDDGCRFVVDFVCKGETLTSGHMQKDVTAFSPIPSVVCVLAPDLVSTMKRAYPQAAVQLYELTLSAQDRMIEHMTLLARGGVREKISHFLFTLARRNGLKREDSIEVDLPMTRGDIGDYLGLNTETVSRQFSQLKKSGAIQLPKPDRLIIPNIEAFRIQSPLSTRIELPN
jgi:CRP/FNR family transcriptional regulator